MTGKIRETIGQVVRNAIPALPTALSVPALLIAAVVATATISLATAQTSLDLPDIGDPAATGLPLSQEKRLAPVILRQLRSQLPVLEDVELNEYLSALGRQLLSAETRNELDFHFLLVRQPNINAFATPGGIIAINSGLILATESESELAGVLAHEITHVTQRHLARLISESKKMSWVGYLAAIGTVLAAAYDSRLAALGAHAGAALPLERALGYSRTFEREADHLGMRLMVAANYNPEGMPRFFSRLQTRESRTGSNVPEFLRTHPLTVHRLSDTFTRAARYQGEYRDDSREFMLAHARLAALTDPQQTLLKKAQTPIERYRRAVALTQTDRAHEAVRMLENLPQIRETTAGGLALAEAYLAQGDHHAAIALLRSLDALHPGRTSIAYHLADALLRANKPAAAQARLRPVARHRHAPIFDKLLAKAAAANGKAWMSHKYLADYHQRNGRMQAALEQLALAEKDPKINKPARELIKAERRKIEKIREEMKRGL